VKRNDAMRINQLIEEQINDENIVLYHGTSESPELIKKQGLIASGRHKAVFLTDNPDLAINYAETDQERTGNDYVTIITVNSKDLDESLLVGDADHTGTEDWKESLKEEDQCMYLGNISANIIKVEEY
jgi:hypothetical protein